MTLFVYDGKTLVSDKAEYKYGVVINDAVSKIYSFEHGGITCAVAGAGSVTDLLAIRDFIHSAVRSYIGELNISKFEIQDPERYKELMASFEDYDCIVVFSDGKESFGYYLGKQPYPIPIKQLYAGGYQDAVHVAIGAMHAGANAEEATKIAVRVTCIAQADQPLDVLTLVG